MDIQIDTSRIFKHFKGINEEIDSLRAQYNRFMQKEADKYNGAYLATMKAETVKTMKAKFGERVQKAKEEIAAIKEELQQQLNNKPVDPADSPTPMTTQDKILIELKKLNAQQVYRSKLELAENVKELTALFEEHKNDFTFYQIFELELEKRLKQNGGAEYVTLKSKVSPVLNVPELSRIEASLGLFASADMFPAGIENDWKSPQFEPYL